MRRRFQIFLAVFLLCVPLSGISQGQFFFFEQENSLIGKEVPDFTLKTLSGKDVNLADFRNGEKTIIFFWATWCPHCRTELGNLNGRAEELRKKKIKIALVDIGENAKVVGSYIKKNNVDFDVFLDEQEKLTDLYGVVGVPTFYFVDEKGIVRMVTHNLEEDFGAGFQEG